MSDAFTVRDALAQGTSREALRSPALDRPFHGTRVLHGSIRDHVDLCRAYAVRMPSESAFSGTSAALIWGLPLPARFARPVRVEVSRAMPRRPPRGRGVVGRRHDAGRVATVRHVGLSVLGPADTWCSLGGALDVADLVAVGDAVVTPPFRADAALASVDELRDALERHAGCAGAPRLRAALRLIRVGALSRPESHLRIAAVTAGLPEPEVNLRLEFGEARFMLDLAWPPYRVGCEYDGDGHRDRERFQADLMRHSLVTDEWDLVRVGSRQLYGATADTVGRLARRLARAGWIPPARFDVSRMVAIRA